MERWKWIILIVCMALMILVVPVMAASNTEKELSECIYYKVGVLFKADGANFKEIDPTDQGLHMHGTIPNKYNIVGIEKTKYIKEYDLWFLKLTGYLEVSQEVLP